MSHLRGGPLMVADNLTGFSAKWDKTAGFLAENRLLNGPATRNTGFYQPDRQEITEYLGFLPGLGT